MAPGLWIAVIALAALPVIGWTWRRAAERREARRPPLGEYVEAGGRRLHVVRRGHGGPPVVIESGGAFSSAMWWPIQDRLSALTTVVTYDRAGLGSSDRAPRPRTIQDRAADLEAMLTKIGLEPPYVLVGHSYGGPLIRTFASRHPDQVAGMVFVDIAHEAVFSAPAAQAYVRRVVLGLRAIGALAQVGALRLARVRGLSQPATAIAYAPDHRRALRSRPPTAHSFLAGADEFGSMRDIAAAMRGLNAPGLLGRIPVAVISHGKPYPGPFAVLERNHPEAMQALADLSDNSVLTVAGDSMHAVPLEEPQVVIDAITAVQHAARTGTPLRDASSCANSPG